MDLVVPCEIGLQKWYWICDGNRKNFLLSFPRFCENLVDLASNSWREVLILSFWYWSGFRSAAPNLMITPS